MIVGVDPDPANKKKISTWAKEYWSALHPYSAGGAYVNFMMEEGEDRIRATYGKNYERLAKIIEALRSGELMPRKSEHQAEVKEEAEIKS